jgi:nicotinate-nucleotide pyrophosphorylase (carboxylating)
MREVKNSLGLRWQAWLRAGLEDDGWEFDWTSLGASSDRSATRISARILAKSNGVWAGGGCLFAASELSRSMGGELALKSGIEDGDSFKPGDTIVSLKGPARTLLALERPLLNLTSYVSGIATRTEALVRRVRKACPERTPRVTSTRKTLPGYRDLAVYGVLAGGGHSHRLSLSGGVLIKENHVAAAGGIARAIEGARRVAPHGLKIECEVRNLEELDQALDSRADGVLLDNFRPKGVKDALKLIAKRAGTVPVVEVSGGLDEENIASYAIPGVDVLSVGSLTHSVRAVDLSLLVE